MASEFETFKLNLPPFFSFSLLEGEPQKLPMATDLRTIKYKHSSSRSSYSDIFIQDNQILLKAHNSNKIIDVLL